MMDEEEMAELKKAKAREREQGKEAKEARTVEDFQFLKVNDSKADKKNKPAVKKGKAKTAKAKPKKKGGRSEDESLGSNDSLNNFIADDDEIEPPKKGKKKAQTKK